MKTIILGNGFDIDLGFPTRYKDFLGSTDFLQYLYDGLTTTAPNDHPSNIFKYIEKQVKEDSRWTDVEYTLSEYAKQGNLYLKTRLGQKASPNVSNQEISLSYDNLIRSLKDYLLSIQFTKLAKRSSVAYAFLKAISSYDENDLSVLSFNYTLPKEIFPELNIANKIENIHGDIKSNIILGFNDSGLYDSTYEYMVKIKGRDSKVADVKSKIYMSDELVFFGHSLGESDRDYFQDTLRFYSKRVIFITYNDESKAAILNELNKMGASFIINHAEWYYTSQPSNRIIIL